MKTAYIASIQTSIKKKEEEAFTGSFGIACQATLKN